MLFERIIDWFTPIVWPSVLVGFIGFPLMILVIYWIYKEVTTRGVLLVTKVIVSAVLIYALTQWSAALAMSVQKAWQAIVKAFDGLVIAGYLPGLTFGAIVLLLLLFVLPGLIRRRATS